MHLLVEILFDIDSKVSVNSSEVASHAPDCRQQAVN